MNIISDIIEYKDIYKKSTKDSDAFWEGVGSRISWYEKWDKISNVDYTKALIKWYENGKLNASYNCLDRHVENGDADRVALIWEGNNPADDKKYTYLLFWWWTW